jgi:hypothetical protein
MSVPTLLAELDAAGIHLRRAGEDLLAEVPPGASLDPYRERIRTSKRALLAELLRGEIVAALYADPRDFDRDAYLALVERWRACSGEEQDGWSP